MCLHSVACGIAGSLGRKWVTAPMCAMYVTHNVMAAQAIIFGGLVPPTSFKQIITCVGVGLLGYGAQITLTHGLRSAKAAPAIATSYLSVVWGILASLFIFHEVGCSFVGSVSDWIVRQPCVLWLPCGFMCRRNGPMLNCV